MFFDDIEFKMMNFDVGFLLWIRIFHTGFPVIMVSKTFSPTANNRLAKFAKIKRGPKNNRQIFLTFTPRGTVFLSLRKHNRCDRPVAEERNVAVGLITRIIRQNQPINV